MHIIMRRHPNLYGIQLKYETCRIPTWCFHFKRKISDIIWCAHKIISFQHWGAYQDQITNHIHATDFFLVSWIFIWLLLFFIMKKHACRGALLGLNLKIFSFLQSCFAKSKPRSHLTTLRYSVVRFNFYFFKDPLRTATSLSLDVTQELSAFIKTFDYL